MQLIATFEYVVRLIESLALGLSFFPSFPVSPILSYYIAFYFIM